MSDVAALIRAKLDEMVEDPGKPYQSCAGCEYDCNCQAYIGYQAAILAVLELHKRESDSVGGTVSYCCSHCRDTGWGGPAVDWPCETVETIAKELGIEATP
jgi:hypothetical protein